VGVPGQIKKSLLSRYFASISIVQLYRKSAGIPPSYYFGRPGKENHEESVKEIRVTAELSGVDEKDIDITLSGHNLTIHGEKIEIH